MKKILFPLLFLLLLSSVFALPVEDVRLSGYVNDYTNTLTQEETLALSYIPQSLHEQGVAQLAIVIVDNFDKWSKEEYG